jgi:predicted Zn-dependent protease
LDPRAMAEAFARIDRESKDLPGALEYLSTHPSTASRIDAAKSAAPNPATYHSMLTPSEWKQIQVACYSAPPSGKGR